MSLPRYEPMLATAWPQQFSDPGWSFELKVDGVRVVLHWDGAHVALRTRRGRDAAITYPELADFRHDRPCVLDGEVVALDDAGLPSFGLLQQRMNIVDHARVADARLSVPVSFVVFDLLHDGGPLIDLPIERRRERLAVFELPRPCVRAEVVEGDGAALWQFVTDNDLEGMVAKRLGSAYWPGRRSPDWRKVANRHLVRVVVGGYTPGDGGRAPTFGALVVGLWDGESLRWVGAVGSGFDDVSLRIIRSQLDEIRTTDCPFLPDPDLPAAVWVEPVVVATVEYKEWTSAARLRAPVFKSVTRDPASGVTWDTEGPADRET